MLVICKVRQFYRHSCEKCDKLGSFIGLHYTILLVMQKIRQFYRTTLIVNVQSHTVLLDLILLVM